MFGKFKVALFLLVFLINIFLVLSFNASAVETFDQNQISNITGLRELNEADELWISENMTKIQTVIPNSLSNERAIENASTNLNIQKSINNYTTSTYESPVDSPITIPNHVDNSKLPSFPPIRSQGSLGTCGAFATTYYQLTHTIGLSRGWDAKNDSDDTKKFSPKFTYNLLANGYNSFGLSIADCYKIMLKHGCATWNKFPYVGDTSNSTNFSAWPTSYDIWRDAVNNKIDNIGYIDIGGNVNDTPLTSYDDVDLQVIKRILANGDVLVFATYMYSWNYYKIKDDANTSLDDEYANKDICVFMDGTSGGHAMTVVGYDDNIWVDINQNNIVEPAEKGAFKIANSWGDTWKDKGFTYVAYDALNKISAISGGINNTNRRSVFLGANSSNRLYTISVNKDYFPKVLAEVTLNQKERNQADVYIGYINPNNVDSTVSWAPLTPNVANSNVSYDGSHEYSDATFVYDITNLCKSITANDKTIKKWFVKIVDKKNDGIVTTIKAFKIIDVMNNITTSSTDSFPKTVDYDQITCDIDYNFDTSLVTNEGWSNLADMTVNRSEFPSAYYDGEIYTVGGFNGQTELNFVEAYNKYTNSWTVKSPMLLAKRNAELAVCNDNLYLIGGRIGNSGSNLGLKTVEVYNSKENSWKSVTGLQTGRSEFGAVVLNNKIYAIGGFTNWDSVNSTEEYNPITNKWIYKANTSYKRLAPAVGTANGKIYAIGGYSDVYRTNYVPYVEEYDPTKNIWQVKSRMPMFIEEIIDCTSINDKIYIVGKYDHSFTSGICFNVIIEYDPLLESWNILTSIPTSRYGLSLTSVDNSIFAIGGSIKPDSIRNDIYESKVVETFKLSNNTSTTKDNLIVKAPIFTNQNNYLVKNIYNVFKAKIGIINSELSNKNIKIIIAYCYNDKIQNIDVFDKQIDAQSLSCIEQNLNYNSKIDKIKVMVWDNIQTLSPISFSNYID